MANNCQGYGYVLVNLSGQGKRSGPSDATAPNKRARYDSEFEEIPCEDPWQLLRQKHKIFASPDFGYIVTKIDKPDKIARLKIIRSYKQAVEPHRGRARGDQLREELFQCLKSALEWTHLDWRSLAIEKVLELATNNGVPIAVSKDDYDCFLAYYMGQIVFDKDGNPRGRRKRTNLDKFVHWHVSGTSLEPIVALLKGYEITRDIFRPQQIIQFLRKPRMGQPKIYHEIIHTPLRCQDPVGGNYLDPFVNDDRSERIEQFMGAMRALDKYLHEPRENFIPARIEYYLHLYRVAQDQARIAPYSEVPYLIKELIREMDPNIDADQIAVPGQANKHYQEPLQ
ncbi:hypothetical protein TRVA0_030S01442 [Trichomonascus vanleenenianus]|uniref:uncharacterized protein n=1 Tax=Trichomonascus vanleenenianus TaxID=2268995 RepID=UPI003EC96812